ncbi:MAG: hypothetical protein CMJ18_21610 [Phycisphaeraceae bacterium]|nr:hypothetical protein [Phycisphaeraceae bacterium]
MTALTRDNGPMLWSTDFIADAVAAGLEAHARQDDLEQAVYGFDHLDELGLHPIVQQALRDADIGVWPEQRYPSHWLKKSRSEGLRCDVVLTPDPGSSGLRDPEIRDTLFDLLPACDPEDAYWLEIKTVAQYTVDGPFPRYTTELLSPVPKDIKKLWGDGIIRHAGLLLVLFAESKITAEHDLDTWYRKCLERGYPLGAPARRGFRITDRIGNGYCEVGVFAVRGV